MKVKVFRCRICGDPYIGENPPTRCPFCGAQAKYIIDAHDWDTGEFDVELTEVSKKNLAAALELELDNTAFYSCALESAKSAGDEYMAAKFKSLMKVEREHASTICKFLKGSACGEPPEGTCSADGIENSKEGHQREDRAIKAYSRFRREATEPRMKEFLGALVEIETEHIQIHAADTA
ncbi:MAG: ferritin family protein [Planctomycetia bacterium]|nr:ferritin family protein [Planctomycetia bacterium]